jgi:hypothetical protein
LQAQAIPAILSGSDVAIASETGSGKTLAYLLPIMHSLKQRQQSQKKNRPDTARYAHCLPWAHTPSLPATWFTVVGTLAHPAAAVAVMLFLRCPAASTDIDVTWVLLSQPAPLRPVVSEQYFPTCVAALLCVQVVSSLRACAVPQHPTMRASRGHSTVPGYAGHHHRELSTSVHCSCCEFTQPPATPHPCRHCGVDTWSAV